MERYMTIFFFTTIPSHGTIQDNIFAHKKVNVLSQKVGKRSTVFTLEYKNIENDVVFSMLLKIMGT